MVPDVDREHHPVAFMMVYQPTDQEGWQGLCWCARSRIRRHRLPPSRAPFTRFRRNSLWSARARFRTYAPRIDAGPADAVVFGGSAGVALLISVVGVAGVLAFSVSGRTREFGIRMSLGAQRWDILKDVLLQGVTIAWIGVGAGVLFGIVFMRGISKYVAEVHLPGMPSFVASALIILAASLIASAVTAARAARVNAVEALRSE